MSINPERLLRVLIAPINTEKTTIISSNNQYGFRVVSDATKHEIKTAVESLFNVIVDGVRVVNVKGKSKRFAQREGTRKSWKKAYVSLKQGSEISFATNE